MILFHYYVYSKSFREIDRIDLSASVVHLACKLNYSYIKYEEMLEIVEILKKKKRTNELKMGNYEIDLLLFLGFDCNFFLPYEFLSFFNKKFSMEKTANKIIKIIINESYRRPLCIFFHPKTICLSAIFIYENYLFENEVNLTENNANNNSYIRFKTLKDFIVRKKTFNDNNLNFENDINTLEGDNNIKPRTKEFFLNNENIQVVNEFDECYKIMEEIVVNSKIKGIK